MIYIQQLRTNNEFAQYLYKHELLMPRVCQLLLTLMAWVGGYNGTHNFTKPGDTYEGYPEIILIRVVSTVI